jgi:integrase
VEATVRDCYVAWERAHTHLSSIRTERGRALNDLLPALGDRPAAELSPLELDEYRAARAAVVTRRGRAPTVSTVNREIVLLHRVLNFAVSRRLIAANPIKGAVKLLREPPPPDVVVDERGIAAILAELRDEQARAWTILAFESGMRRGEIRRLCWHQLDWAAGTIAIPGAHTKNGKGRVVEFPARSQAALAALARAGDRVFTRHPRFLYGLYVAAVNVTGVVGADGKRPTWHALRRSYVTLMRRRGVQESVVMRLSGHRDRSVFERYNVIVHDDVKAAIEANAAGRAKEIAQLRTAPRRPPRQSPSSPRNARFANSPML